MNKRDRHTTLAVRLAGLVDLRTPPIQAVAYLWGALGHASIGLHFPGIFSLRRYMVAW